MNFAPKHLALSVFRHAINASRQVRFICNGLNFLHSYIGRFRGILPLFGTRLSGRCYYHVVKLQEEDIEERFVKGWGKGGQKVNKTNNCVELRHVPTGIVIKCHQTRSLTRNRSIARELLLNQLDQLYNGKDSKAAIQIAKIKKRKATYARRRKQRDEIIDSIDSTTDAQS